MANHVLLHLFGCVKAERRQIANIQLDDFLALVFHLARGFHNRATNIVEYMCEFAGFEYGFHRANKVKTNRR